MPRCSNCARQKQEPNYDFAIGSSRCHLSISQRRQSNELTAELYIPDDMELFDLLSYKKTIKRESGLSFDWQELSLKKAGRILAVKSADFDDRNAWPAQFFWYMNTLETMKQVFTEYL